MGSGTEAFKMWSKMILAISFVLILVGVVFWEFLGVSADTSTAHIIVFFVSMFVAMLVGFMAMSTKMQKVSLMG